ncbi:MULTISPECIES: hypothetical protein [unclassified Streptomyces]|uniref:hypothetical protein n=1 Tax=unclassified Streptomyces TaxID=2593676 RepID=UPI00278BC6A4|nr:MULTISPECIES: hypothetical protein [unclassified Streptomyces]
MSTTAHTVVPYITIRRTEQAESFLMLGARTEDDGRSRLAHLDEERDDRDLHRVLWARVCQSLGPDLLPSGDPQWGLVHPSRQRETRLRLRCQVCWANTEDHRREAPARPGVLFLHTAGSDLTQAQPVRTWQPPIRVEHARLAVTRCPALGRKGHVALLARRYRLYGLYGVIGTPHERTLDGVRAPASNDIPVPYRDPRLRRFLASQLVRELTDFGVVNLEELTPA